MDRIEVVKSYMQVDISMAKENNSHASSTREKYVYVYLDDADLLLTALASKDKRIEELEGGSITGKIVSVDHVTPLGVVDYDIVVNVVGEIDTTFRTLGTMVRLSAAALGKEGS